MFETSIKSIKIGHLRGEALVNSLLNVIDKRGVLTHYIASLEMHIDGKARTVLAQFYPAQDIRLAQVLGMASFNRSVKATSKTAVFVELLDVRKPVFGRVCTAKLINAMPVLVLI